MATENSKFNMDLDDTPTAKLEPTVKETKPVKKAPEKFPGENVILPIPWATDDGATSTVCKNIEDVTGDEFLSWMKSVMPMSDATIQKFIDLKSSKGATLDDLKVRNNLFKAIVELHEYRWLFRLGKPSSAGNN